MKISIERLKEIIKEELEAQALDEGNGLGPAGLGVGALPYGPEKSILDRNISLGQRTRRPVEPIEVPKGPEKFDAPEQTIAGDVSLELPKSWKEQQQMAKTGKVFVRKNQGYFHLTHLLRLAAPQFKKNLNPRSKKSRSLVAKMVRKMQNGKSTLRTRKDYGTVVNYLDLQFGRERMNDPQPIQGYWKHLPDPEAAIKNRGKYVAAGIVPSAMPSDDVLNNKVVVVVARNSAYGLTLQQAQTLRKYILKRQEPSTPGGPGPGVPVPARRE